MNIPVSFVDIKNFLIDSFRESSIYDFYSGKHLYLDNTDSLKPEIKENSVLEIFNKKYNISCNSLSDLRNWLNKNYEYIKDYNKYIEESELNFKNEIEKLNIKLKQTENNIENNKTKQLNVENQIIEVQNEIENFPAVEEKNNLRINEINEEINALSALKEKEPYKTQIENLNNEKIKIPLDFEQYKLNLNQKLENLSNQKQEVVELLLQLNDEIVNIKKEIELKEVEKNKEINKFKEKEFNQKDEENAWDFLKYFLYINSKEFNYNNNYFVGKNNNNNYYFHNPYNLFSWLFEIYKPQNVDLIELKKVLLEMLNEEIPNPYVFKNYKKHDSENIHDYTKIKLGNIRIASEESIDLVFSVWNSLKNALNTEDIMKNVNNIYYLSLGKFIYAKIMIYKNNSKDEKLLVALQSPNTSITLQKIAILSGYQKNGHDNNIYILNNANEILHGVVIAYKDYFFMIDFNAKVL